MWKILRASVPGSAHVKAKTPCQDAHSAMATSDGVLVVACADGAGSAQRSDEGATAAAAEFVSAACSLVREKRELGEAAVLECFRAARRAVEARAVRIEVPRRELACTLLGAIVGPEQAWFGQIGDGLIVVGENGTGYSPVFWPHAGDYLNESDFLTDERYEARLQLAQRKAPGELALTTDGLQLLMANLAARSIHHGFFAPIFARLREIQDETALLAPLQEFLESAAVNARTDDDKTLLLAVRR
ncbi:MAG TPA: PP2C family serine/threonine-protein phosphatase [Myxococcales bacterium]